jgi:hypothetical protein
MCLARQGPEQYGDRGQQGNPLEGTAGEQTDHDYTQGERKLCGSEANEANRCSINRRPAKLSNRRLLGHDRPPMKLACRPSRQPPCDVGHRFRELFRESTTGTAVLRHVLSQTYRCKLCCLSLGQATAWIAEQPEPQPTRAEALRRFAANVLKVK